MELLRAENLVKAFKKRVVVNRASFSVNSGEIVGLLGPNGAGKTTAFRMVIGLIKPDGGKVLLNGEDITDLPIYQRARRGMGYLAQEPSVFQKLTVQDNVLAILETMRLSRRERYRRARELLKDLRLDHLAKQPAYSLSGGERRRLEITRALTTNPSLLLLDEPFSGVDPIAVGEIQEIIARLSDRGIGILLTDHSVRETLSITDHAYIINNGKIEAAGTPSEIVSNERVRRIYLGDSVSESDIKAKRASKGGRRPPTDTLAPPPSQSSAPEAPNAAELEL